MKRFCTVIAETFLLLRRDRVFLPVIVIMILAMWFANLASYWGTEEYKKILYDLGTTGINLAGIMVAIFWGTKLIADSKKEGSLELQLAAPVSRGRWLVGKYIGLSATLIFIEMCMLLIWQGFLLLNRVGWMEQKHLTIFAFDLLGWLVIAALAVCLASLSSQMTAMFCCACAWAVGSMSQSIAKTLNPETPKGTRIFAETIAKYWDLQKFNLADYASIDSFISSSELWWRAIYGLTLCLFFVTTAAILFTKKDVVSQ